MECGEALKDNSKLCSACGTNVAYEQEYKDSQPESFQRDGNEQAEMNRYTYLIWIPVVLVLVFLYVKAKEYFHPKIEVFSCAGDEMLISSCTSIGANMFGAAITECSFNNPTELTYNLSDYKVWAYDKSGIKLGIPNTLDNIALSPNSTVRARFSPVYSGAQKVSICPYDLDNDYERVFAHKLEKINVE